MSVAVAMFYWPLIFFYVVCIDVFIDDRPTSSLSMIWSITMRRWFLILMENVRCFIHLLILMLILDLIKWIAGKIVGRNNFNANCQLTRNSILIKMQTSRFDSNSLAVWNVAHVTRTIDRKYPVHNLAGRHQWTNSINSATQTRRNAKPIPNPSNSNEKNQ